jgi:hypothetical protein
LSYTKTLTFKQNGVSYKLIIVWQIISYKVLH